MHYYEKLKIIENNLEAFTKEATLNLKSQIDNDAELEMEFFKKVSSVTWFDWFKEAGYFKPDNIKFNDQGNALFWIVLDYLEKISVQSEQNQQYAKELIEIIDNVVNFSINNKKINNYYIWWYFVKIINNLPDSVIKENLPVEKFNKWLDVWTEHSMGDDLSISDIGKKLLPKFLKDSFAPDGYKYAEVIVDVITKIKPSKSVSSINNRESTVIAWNSYWVRQAFNENGRLVGEKCSIGVIERLANRLNDALKYKQKNHYSNIEIENDIYQIWVSRVELESGKIGFKEDSYECIVRQYSQEQIKNIDKNDHFSLHNTEPEVTLKQFSFEAKNKAEMVKLIKNNLPENIEWTKNSKFQQKIGNIYEGLFSDYSYIRVRSLEIGAANYADNAEDILLMILRDILLSKCGFDAKLGYSVLELLLNGKYKFPVFKRFVLLCIDKYWGDYSKLFDKIIDDNQDILDEEDMEVELHDVLSHHHASFSQELIDKIKILLNRVPAYYVEKGEKSSAWWKFKWLSSLRDNNSFKSLYEEAKQIAEPKEDKPYEPERSTVKGGWVTHKSPISAEEMLQKPVSEIVKYLNSFKDIDFWQGSFEGRPDKEGLAGSFYSAVKKDSKKFTDEIDEFLNVDYLYINNLVKGLMDSWKEGKDIDWDKIFPFCVEYLEKGKDSILKDAFQTQGEDSGNGKYIWIVESIADLIEEGCKNDKHAFDNKHFEVVENIFDLICPLLKGEKKPDTQKDALTYALNTSLGRIVKAYIAFSLHISRVTKKKPSNWGNDKYERFIKVGIEAYIWFGSYLPQMYHLDKEYTQSKVKYFAGKPDSDFEWQMFMEGYLTAAQIYNDIYTLMRENYIKGLECSGFNERAEQRLAEHICIGYLYLKESLSEKNEDGKESLFFQMLMSAGKLSKQKRWLEVVNFFWSNSHKSNGEDEQNNKKEKLPKESINKILEFWRWSYDNQEIVKLNLGDEYHTFLGKIAELTIVLNNIGAEEEKWLLLSASHVEKPHNTDFFIKYLARFEDEDSIKRIGKIFREILVNATPTFHKEDIEKIVSRIYDMGIREDAEAICETYGRRGAHFLRPIWEKNQK